MLRNIEEHCHCGASKGSMFASKLQLLGSSLMQSNQMRPPRLRAATLAVVMYRQVIQQVRVTCETMFRPGSHTQWLARQRTFIWRRVLLKCSLRPPAASVPMPCRCSWFMAISLFPMPTDLNFSGNSWMARVMCVASQVTGPRGHDRQVSVVSSEEAPEQCLLAWSCPCLDFT